MNTPRVAIIILNWNNWKDTRECLESVHQISYPHYQVIVVDNGSTDDSVFRIREDAPEGLIFIENEKNLGFAGGNNLALELAREKLDPDYFLLLNNDTVVDPHFLEILVDYAQQDEKIGVVGPTVYYYHHPDRIAFQGGCINPCTGRVVHHRLDEVDKAQEAPQELDFVSGCSLLLKREVLDRVGLLDPDYFLYNEDVDWCLRAKSEGYQVFLVPEAKIWHKVSVSVDNSLIPSYYGTRNQFLLARKHCPSIQRYLFFLRFTLARVAASLESLLKGQNRESRVILRGVKDGWTGNYGFREL
jgi:GT2 family glycosyltransferase